MSRYFCHEYPEILLVETRVVDARPGAVLLEQSPFHPGGGGQLADRGVLRWSGGEARVTGIEAVDGRRYWHLVGEPVAVSGLLETFVTERPLPDDARAAIGEVHADTLPARAMLESEGFRYEGYVDIFDAGPTLECFRDNIRAVRQSQLFPVTIGEEDPVPDSLSDDVLWLVANRDLARFRAVLCAAPARIAQFPLMPHAALALGVSEADTVRAVPLAPRDRA